MALAISRVVGGQKYNSKGIFQRTYRAVDECKNGVAKFPCYLTWCSGARYGRSRGWTKQVEIGLHNRAYFNKEQ